MSQKVTPRGCVIFVIAVFTFILACSISTASPPAAPAFDPTKIALEYQATAMSLQLTQAELNTQTQQPTQTPPPAINSPAPTPTEIQPTPTQDIEARIKAANVLVYENTDARNIGMWIQDALDGLGIDYTQTGSYSGNFME